MLVNNSLQTYEPFPHNPMNDSNISLFLWENNPRSPLFKGL
jgi:hypothetical protein